MNTPSKTAESKKLIDPEKSGSNLATKTAPNVAEITINPQVNAAVLLASYSPDLGGCRDVADLLDAVYIHAKAIKSGDLSNVEAMLYGQAVALQGMFVDLAMRAKKQTGLPQIQSLLTLSLRAQGQCRTTLEALAEIKQPRPVFARQVNTGNNVQVNNGQPATVPSPRAQEKDVTPTNELLTSEVTNATLDTRGAQPTGGINRELEAVAPVDRGEDVRRKSRKQTQRPQARDVHQRGQANAKGN